MSALLTIEQVLGRGLLSLPVGAFSSGSVLRHFVVEGGWITWFVLIPLSLTSVALIVYYLITIRRSAHVPAELARALVTAANQGQGRVILEITREDHTMLGQAAAAGVTRLKSGLEAAKAAIDDAVDGRATKLFRKIEYLNVIGNVSPMVGLFGTVVGMISAFNRIFAAGGGMPDASQLAGDIAVALVTTFWGLLIAIPALSAFALFRNRIDAFAAECVNLCNTLVTMVYEARPAVPAVPPTASAAARAAMTRSALTTPAPKGTRVAG